MEFRLPIKLDFRTDYTLVRVSIFLVIPALLAAPLLEGALSWKSSVEAAGLGVARSGNPAAEFYSWQFFQPHYDHIWAAASLAAITWENGTFDNGETKSHRCRHVITYDQFLPGTKLHNATIPCIAVHSISWPTTPMPPSVRKPCASLNSCEHNGSSFSSS